jgi:hypothetical protein
VQQWNDHATYILAGVAIVKRDLSLIKLTSLLLQGWIDVTASARAHYTAQGKICGCSSARWSRSIARTDEFPSASAAGFTALAKIHDAVSSRDR